MNDMADYINMIQVKKPKTTKPEPTKKVYRFLRWEITIN